MGQSGALYCIEEDYGAEKIVFRNIMKWLLIIGLLASPAIGWAMFKPIRVVAPEWVGDVKCDGENICIDDVTRLDEAFALHQEARDFVATAVGPFEVEPVVVFCSTTDCAQSFGLGKRTAVAVGKFGIVLGPKGWKPYYLRHEMIHHRQAEVLGVLRHWRSPEWFKEGMAYALSEDPRILLSEPWQSYRMEFEAWYENVGKRHLWGKARGL
jgi:hypothetical protein